MESNIIKFVGILNECASVMALEKGMCVHEQIVHMVLIQMCL